MEKPKRKLLRLQDYDYSQNGAYFVTICTQNRVNLFGEIECKPNVGAPLPRMVDWYKTMTTNTYIKGVKQGLYPPFDKRVWQRGYFERIIRNDAMYQEAWTYIDNNPIQWTLDKYYTP